MAIIRLYMTMSLDGYVTGPRDDAAAPLGVGGFRLFNWLDLRDQPPLAEYRATLDDCKKALGN